MEIGRDLSLIWGIPFAGMLLSIALCPLIAPKFWHDHHGKIAGLWSLALIIPFTLIYGAGGMAHELSHTLIMEYLPFIIMLIGLFTIAGGVHVTGTLVDTPLTNTAFLALGACLASLMGTTGASILLIRPLIKVNQWRTYKTHTIVFFIFLVSNIGGALSPLGDPPLFLGYLNGVDFFWPIVHLFKPMILLVSVLLVTYALLDLYLYTQEKRTQQIPRNERKVVVKGRFNLVLLGCVVGAILLGSWQTNVQFFGVPVELILSNGSILALAYISWKFTPKDTREANDFSWFPMVEVAKLFVGIFITIIPILLILKAGDHGALGSLKELMHESHDPIPAIFFWITGILSSFLDNAPTYLVFFNMAGGDARMLMVEYEKTLIAISAGAVFMGAMTYIGNAPNFMVKSIAEDLGVKMPSFFGYMLWSAGLLLPLFALVTYVFLGG